MKLCHLLFLLVFPIFSQATIRTERVEYLEGETVLEGFQVFDDAVEGKRPGILVAHDWKGIGEYVESRSRELAGLGYIVFAADIYGKGIRPSTPEEAGKEATKYKDDRALLKRRITAGLNVLKENPVVDTARIAAIGYCFGGMAVLELARSGADVAGVISFHGTLSSPAEEQGPIKAKVLALHGADDPHVPPAEVAAFQDEMRRAGADWQLNIYGGAVHSFTNPAAGNDPSKGAAYQEKADKRSWGAMLLFFSEIFGN